MKNWQFIIVILLITIGFFVMYFQNNEILRQSKVMKGYILDVPKASYNYMIMEGVIDNDIEYIKKNTNSINDKIDSYGGLIYRLIEYAEE